MMTSNPITAVAPDVYQVRLPLPFRLDHVNCYLLRGDDGWTILDAGLNTSRARAIWEATFTELDIVAEQIKQIVLTHVHPDHYGLAGWLQQWSVAGGGQPVVYLSAREAELADSAWKDAAGQVQRMTTYFVQCGMPPELAENVASETNKVSSRTLPHPERVAHLHAGDTIMMGNRQFQIFHAPGHSDGQLIFYDATDRLLLCGDHVLIKITPHIGFWPGAEDDPLRRYLNSLRQLAELDVRLALPGHRAQITDWVGRLTEMQTHHDERLSRTLEAVGQGSTVSEISQAVFRLGELNVHEARFAIAETLSHLEYLRIDGEITRAGEEVWHYRLTS